MFSIHLNHKGLSLVESLVAVFLTTVAVMSLMPMQDMASRTASKSDYLGRAQGILQTNLEARELEIMNTANTVTAGTTTKQVTASGLSSVTGDATFTVATTTSVNAVASNSWLVNVRVTWTGNTTGVSSSMIVTRQSGFE